MNISVLKRLMEATIRRISTSRRRLKKIVRSENPKLIEETYRLLLYHDCPLHLFLKMGLEYELRVQDTSIFRERRPFNRIVTELFARERIITPLVEKVEKSLHRSRFDVKKVCREIVSFLWDTLISLISETLVDFLSQLCARINSMNVPGFTGERLVCSFFVFRVLSPALLALVNDDERTNLRVMKLVKRLNAIALGDDQSVLKEHDRLLNLMGRVLLRQKG